MDEMAMTQIAHKKLERILVASRRFLVDVDDAYESVPIPYPEIIRRLRELKMVCAGVASGPMMLIIHTGSYKQKKDYELAVPLSHPHEEGLAESRSLPGGEAISITFRGPHEAFIRGVGRELGEELSRSGVRPLPASIIVFHEIHDDAPENNVTELICLDLDWAGRLAEHAGEVLGEMACERIMRGVREDHALDGH